MSPTPVAGVDLEFDIPAGCFAIGDNICMFKIAVDGRNDVKESNELTTALLMSSCRAARDESDG
jgi:hypothetical protein